MEQRVYKRSLISRHGLLYLMASMVRRFLSLTQFIIFWNSLVLFDVSWIFWLKNECLVHLTIFLNCFQSARLQVDLYFSKFLLQLKSYQLFKCFEILMILKFLSQVHLTVLANNSITFSRAIVSDRLEVSMDEISLIKSLINNFSFSLLLVIDCLQFSECYSSIGMVTVRGVWFNDSLHSGQMMQLSNLTNLYLKNMRSITKFKLQLLYKYLVGTGLVGYNSLIKKKSVISKSKSLWEE